jgi:hypothetical protein
MTAPIIQRRRPNERTTAVRRAALALVRHAHIRTRIIELQRLAEQTARGELPVSNGDPIDDDK